MAIQTVQTVGSASSIRARVHHLLHYYSEDNTMTPEQILEKLREIYNQRGDTAKMTKALWALIKELERAEGTKV